MNISYIKKGQVCPFFILFFLIYQINTNQLLAQYFSLLPEINKDGQAQNFNIIVKDDRFFIIGDLEQVNTKSVIPVISEFDYTGNLLRVDTIKDINFQDNLFLSYDNPHIRISDSIYVFVFSRDIVKDSNLVPYLLKYNIYTNVVLEAKLQFLDPYEFITAIEWDSFNRNIITMTYSFNQPHINKLLIYDDNFTVIDSIAFVDSIGKVNLPRRIFITPDSFLVIGQTTERNNLELSTQIWGLHISKNLKNINHKRIKGSRPIGMAAFFTELISLNSLNEIVIAATHYKTGITQPNDYNFFINPIKLNYSMDSIIWELPLFTKNINSRPRRLYNAMAYLKSEDSYIVAGDEIDKNGACILFKFSNAGDSIWFKRIVPGFLHDTAVSFVPTYNIKVSPRNGILVTGSVHNKISRKILPYIMHLDFEGCLVPGCNTITKAEPYGNNIRLLTNPVSNNLVLKSEVNADDVFMEIIDITGNVILKRKMNLLANSEYVWFANDLHVGVFVLKLYTKNGQILYAGKFIKS